MPSRSDFFSGFCDSFFRVFRVFRGYPFPFPFDSWWPLAVCLPFLPLFPLRRLLRERRTG